MIKFLLRMVEFTVRTILLLIVLVVLDMTIVLSDNLFIYHSTKIIFFIWILEPLYLAGKEIYKWSNKEEKQ